MQVTPQQDTGHTALPPTRLVPPAVAVFVHPNRDAEPEHERQAHAALAECIADIQRLPYQGTFEPRALEQGLESTQAYLVPSGTVGGLERARTLGVTDVRHLF